jgi:hypothetical protein
VIDDDYTLDEGDIMPAAYWRLSEHLTVMVRYRSSRITTAPLLAFADEFVRASPVYGARYLSLYRYTCHNAYLSEWSTARSAFTSLVAAHPDTFTTVIGAGGPELVWLALRLTRLTDPVADTLAAISTAGHV